MLYKDTSKDISGYIRLSSEVCSKPILQLVNTVQRAFPDYVEKQTLVLHRSTHLIVSSLRNWLILGRLISPHTRRNALDHRIRIRGQEVGNGEASTGHPLFSFKPIGKRRESDSMTGRAEMICAR
jgi:hypothetical protein